MEFKKYKFKQMSLEPDKYGKHLKIKMLSQYDEKGNYIKHVKLDENALDIINNGWFIPSETLNLEK